MQAATSRRQRVQRGPTRQNPAAQAPGHQISGCARDYGRCLMNPFTGPLACVPDYPALLTRKTRVFARGTMSTGSSGVGSIVVTPEQAVASDAQCGVFTSATYTGTTIATNSATTGCSPINSNSEYTIASIGIDAAQAQYRIVGSGLRVRYSGTELNRGGQIVALCEPTHENLDGQNTTNLLAQVDARKLPVVNQRWTTVLYKPRLTASATSSGMNQNAPNALTAQSKAAAPSNNYMGMLIVSPDATARSFEFEFYTVFEVTGTNVRGQTPSVVDPIGYAAVHSVSQLGAHRVAHQEPDNKKEDTFMKDVAKYLREGISWVWDHKEGLATLGGAVLALI